MTTDPAQQAFPFLAPAPLALAERPALVGHCAVTYASAQQLLNPATGFLNAYDFSLNPYAGCSFGCTYCYAAFFSPTKETRDTWGDWVTVKQNAVELLTRRKTGSLDGKRIYMSSVTDPYQPIERKIRLTRGILEVLAERHKPMLVVQTRSPDVVRDCDLFKAIEERGGRVQVNMTATTDDEEVRKTFEPWCPDNSVRLRAIAEVQAAGVEACITMTPLLLVNTPYTFVERLLETGVKRFIVQPFHFKRGKFVASTREGAIRLMAKKLGCSIDAFMDRYMEHYEACLQVLDERLPELGQGKEGFTPPF